MSRSPAHWFGSVRLKKKHGCSSVPVSTSLFTPLVKESVADDKCLLRSSTSRLSSRDNYSVNLTLLLFQKGLGGLLVSEAARSFRLSAVHGFLCRDRTVLTCTNGPLSIYSVLAKVLLELRTSARGMLKPLAARGCAWQRVETDDLLAQ